jgi:hypothetical protein
VIDYFPAHVAINPQTGGNLPDTEVQFFDIADTDFTTPVTLTDVQDVPLGTALSSGPTGVFPAFKAPGHTQLVPKSGDVVTPPIFSMYGLLLSLLPDPTDQPGELAVTTDGLDGYTLVPLPTGGTGGGSGWSRAEGSILTASLAAAAQESGIVELGKVAHVFGISVSSAARVRLYDTAAHRDGDAARAFTTPIDTATNHGVFLDVQLDPGVTYNLDINVHTWDNTVNVPFLVTNIGGAPAEITVTLTYLRME